MKFTDFKNELANGKSYSIYLLEGTDAFFKKRAVELLKNKFVTEPTLNYTSFDGNSFTISELVSSLKAYPFMSEKRLTLVTDHNFTKDELKGELKEFLDNPPTDSLFVVSVTKSQDSLKKFSSVCVVNCDKADSNTIVKWIKAECAKSGVEIQAETANLICEYCLSDMTRIETETLKLISYVGSGKTIEKADVDGLVARETEYKIYEMTDYIGKKKFDLALSVINDMLSKGETSQRLIVSIYNYFRRLLHVAISNKTTSELASLIGVMEYAVKKSKEQAKMFKIRSLKKAVDMLADTDYAIKSGRADQNEGMWLAVFKIMTGE